MSAPVRTRRFFGPSLLSGTGQVNMFTCPTDRTAIIKGLVVAVITATVAAPVNVRLRVQIGGVGTAETFWDETFTSPGTRALPGGYLVLDDDDVLVASSTVANVTSVTGSGSLLMGDPS